MTYLFEMKTVSTPSPRPQMPVNPLREPALSFAEQAALDNAAVKRHWDARFVKPPDMDRDMATRRAMWAAMLPDGVFDRPAGRAALGIGDNGADARLDTLERIGLIRRVASKPIRWEKV